jgi:acyl dehydratase
MVGISVGETTLGTAVANLGWDDVRFPKPLFHGDSVRVKTEVLELRPNMSRPDQGVVTYMHRAFNQHDELVAHCRRAGLQKRRLTAACQHDPIYSSRGTVIGSWRWRTVAAPTH